MIDVGKGKSINPAFVLSCEIVSRHYVNGSDVFLNIKMSDGSIVCREHGYGIDVFAIKAAIDSWLGGVDYSDQREAR